MKNHFEISLPKILFKTFLICSLIFSTAAFAQNSLQIYNNNPIIGIVDGEKVTFEDIRNIKVQELSIQLFEQLNIRFIEHTLEKLSAKYSQIKLTPEKKVSQDDIKTFYEKNALKKRGTLQQLAPQIKNYLEKQIRYQHFLNQFSVAIKNGWVVYHLEAPSIFLIKGNAKTAYIRGNKKASVILIEFSDYQCPFCGRIQETINKLIENYKNQVAFGYRHFPLSFHKEADEAAIASECAREQGKFEEMHLLLYSNQNAQKKNDLKKYAREIKLKSTKKFDQCLDSERYRGLVNQDIEDATELGITGTPAFFLGQFDHNSGKIEGEILSGALPYSSFQQSLEKYLNRIK